MNVTPINKNQTTFNGSIITKGHWSKSLLREFLDNPQTQMLANGEYDIIARMSTRKSKHHTMTHAKGEPLYKLTLEAQKGNSPFINSIKSFLGLTSKIEVTRNYHSEDSMEDLMRKRINAKKYADYLDITI